MNRKQDRINKYVKQIKEIDQNKDDRETWHVIADDILCELLKELGYDAVVDAWDDIPKWYA